MGGLFGGGGSQPNSTQETRIASMRFQTSAYGYPIPIVYGQNRITGNVIWYGDFVTIPHVSQPAGGGKGGGGSAPANTTYTYTAGLALALCEGTTGGVQTVWKDKEKVKPLYVAPQVITVTRELHYVPTVAPYRVSVAHAGANFQRNMGVAGMFGRYNSYLPYTTDGAGNYTFSALYAGRPIFISYTYVIPAYTISPMQRLGMSEFRGADLQATWTHLTTKHPTEALSYPGTAYVATSALDLGNSANLPNLSFEMAGKCRVGGLVVDANPKDIITDFLTNPVYGAMYPAASIGDMTLLSNYCIAQQIYLSPVLDAQKTAAEWLTQWLKLCNASVVYSEGKLKFIPYSDEKAGVYQPDLTPLYDLDDDAFISDGSSDPVMVRRSPQSDAYNCIRVEYLNRGTTTAPRDYNPEVIEAKDGASIELYGLRAAEVLKAHEVCTAATAQHVAQALLQRSLYVRNVYEFQLPWRFALLEPMDIVTLTDEALGMNREPVRILSVEEDEDGLLTVTAEEMPSGVAAPARFDLQDGTGFQHDFNVDPGNANAPVLFEPPDLLAGGLELWMAVSGGANWGGCDVWVSRDDTSYTRVGTIHGGARHGQLTAALATGTDPDMAHTLAVDISVSGGQLLDSTVAAADKGDTLCYVDGEYIAYSTSRLTGVGRYNLSGYLRRGLYGTTIGAHAAGAPFARLDKAIFKYPISADMVGAPLYIKLASFNQYGGGQQQLDGLQPIVCNITGAALRSALPNVTKLVSNYRNGRTVLSWQPVIDFRTVDYEVRVGPTWQKAVTLGRTALTEFIAPHDGTYWVAAHYCKNGIFNASQTLKIAPSVTIFPRDGLYSQDLGVTEPQADGTAIIYTRVSAAPAAKQYAVDEVKGIYTFAAADTGLSVAVDYAYSAAAGGIHAYSAVPDSLTIGGASLPANVLVQFDERGSGWKGSCTAPAFYDVVENAVKLGGNLLFSAIPVFSAEVSVEYYGGIASPGYYQIPAAHEIDIGTPQSCNCSVMLEGTADTPFSLFSRILQFSQQSSVMSQVSGKASMQIEIDTSQNATVWEGWRNFVPGQYLARRFRFRVKLMSADPSVSTVLDNLRVIVDVPDRVDSAASLAAPAAGVAVAFATPFHVPPAVQITILDPAAGDVITFPVQPTVNGFTVRITNAGAGVARTLSWTAKG
jgi:hypothetical protein